MTREEADAILKKLEKQVKEDTASPATALGALVAAGLVTEDGQPTEPFRV